jgi:hypothetical protein
MKLLPAASTACAFAWFCAPSMPAARTSAVIPPQAPTFHWPLLVTSAQLVARARPAPPLPPPIA